MRKKALSHLHPMFLLGSDLEDKGDVRGAIRAYRKAARDGDLASQSNLGNLLDDKIRPARPREAVYWYKRAVRAAIGPLPQIWLPTIEILANPGGNCIG